MDDSDDDEANDKIGGEQYSDSLDDFPGLDSALRHSSGGCSLFLFDFQKLIVIAEGRWQKNP